MSAQLKVLPVILDSYFPLNLCCWIHQFIVVVCVGQLLTMFLHFSSQSPTKPETEITPGLLGDASLANREVLTWWGGLLAGKRASQLRITGAIPYWGATARFTFRGGEDTALGISSLRYLSSGSVN